MQLPCDHEPDGPSFEMNQTPIYIYYYTNKVKILPNQFQNLLSQLIQDSSKYHKINKTTDQPW
jgi:hypothetical protein